MISKTALAHIRNTQTALLQATGRCDIKRVTKIKNTQGVGYSKSGLETVDVAVPCRVNEPSQRVDTMGNTLKDQYEYRVTLPYGTQVEFGDQLHITLATGQTLVLVVSRNGVSPLGTAVRVIADLYGGS